MRTKKLPYYIQVDAEPNKGLHRFSNVAAARNALKVIAHSHGWDNHGIETNFKADYGYRAVNKDFTPHRGTSPLSKIYGKGIRAKSCSVRK